MVDLAKAIERLTSYRGALSPVVSATIAAKAAGQLQLAFVADVVRDTRLATNATQLEVFDTLRAMHDANVIELRPCAPAALPSQQWQDCPRGPIKGTVFGFVRVLDKAFLEAIANEHSRDTVADNCALESSDVSLLTCLTCEESEAIPSNGGEDMFYVCADCQRKAES